MHAKDGRVTARRFFQFYCVNENMLQTKNFNLNQVCISPFKPIIFPFVWLCTMIPTCWLCTVNKNRSQFTSYCLDSSNRSDFSLSCLLLSFMAFKSLSQDCSNTSILCKKSSCIKVKQTSQSYTPKQHMK